MLGLGIFSGVSALTCRSLPASTPVSASSKLKLVCCFTLLHPTFKPDPTERFGVVLGSSLQVDQRSNGCDNWAV